MLVLSTRAKLTKLLAGMGYHTFTVSDLSQAFHKAYGESMDVRFAREVLGTLVLHGDVSHDSISDRYRKV